MKIKFFNQDGDTVREIEENIHTSTMYLSAKSIYINTTLYDVIDTVVDLDDEQIQISLEER